MAIAPIIEHVGDVYAIGGVCDKNFTYFLRHGDCCSLWKNSRQEPYQHADRHCVANPSFNRVAYSVDRTDARTGSEYRITYPGYFYGTDRQCIHSWHPVRDRRAL
ncbi:MAG: hypothetical protein R6W68_13735, partial [Ignavibacteriaceae bacterium]